ncbi:uncharacterized protein LOC114328825 isoform X3 [Diabrotica virgifera virgifera]|uniref:Uncharacterized protein LOC114328825 isoform X3 n=1 Tax=Diabrotica virgifera virgifera TaxID=50390 RepID=A0A6P7FD16_DIAVI|nr:uncharacterized protein LOC114328825 isoform X3 [Diabrotica virgifera virgifera]
MMSDNPDNYNGRIPFPKDNSQDKILTTIFVLVGLVVATQVFYIFFITHTAKAFRKEVIRRGRLISVLPIISTIGATMPVHVNVQQTVNVPNAPQQNTYPPNAYTAPDGSRMFDDKVAPPAYVP